MQGQTQSISFDGREIRLTTGRYAPQAGGSVMIECGDTSVLVTATRSKGGAKASISFPSSATTKSAFMQQGAFQEVSCDVRGDLPSEPH